MVRMMLTVGSRIVNLNLRGESGMAWRRPHSRRLSEKVETLGLFLIVCGGSSMPWLPILMRDGFEIQNVARLVRFCRKLSLPCSHEGTCWGYTDRLVRALRRSRMWKKLSRILKSRAFAALKKSGRSIRAPMSKGSGGEGRRSLRVRTI